MSFIIILDEFHEDYFEFHELIPESKSMGFREVFSGIIGNAMFIYRSVFLTNRLLGWAGLRLPDSLDSYNSLISFLFYSEHEVVSREARE